MRIRRSIYIGIRVDFGGSHDKYQVDDKSNGFSRSRCCCRRRDGRASSVEVMLFQLSDVLGQVPAPALRPCRPKLEYGEWSMQELLTVLLVNNTHYNWC
jgi:hypothetical protein